MRIASGKYEHRENGVANGITETWAYDVDTSLLKITFHANYTLSAEVQFDETHRLAQFSYHIDENLNGTYRIVDGKLLVERTLPANTRLEDSLIWSDDAVLDLPFLSCKGHTILHLKKHGTAPTFAPILRSGDRAGDLSKKSVRLIAEEEISLGEKTIPVSHYHYRRDYWLDEFGTVWRVQDNNYEMVLVEYKS